MSTAGRRSLCCHRLAGSRGVVDRRVTFDPVPHLTDPRALAGDVFVLVHFVLFRRRDASSGVFVEPWS